MADATRQWGRRALDFVDAVERLSAPGVVQLFENEIRACGFHAYIMAGLPQPGTALADLTVANGWPAEWFEVYTRENFSAMDPVPRYGAATLQPFEWSEARYDKDSDPAAHLVMTRATEFRLMDGYCIPMHYDDGGAMISLATEHLNLDPAAKSAIQLIGIYAHNRIRSLARPRRDKRDVLTARECEVLRWAAGGKTSWEISVILRISERTVKFHLLEASRKLNAVNRTSAVAKALTSGLIRL
ncbi:MAG TPA: LuxR family transcriptional regulator [Bradyrhizobium sp.]|nr:LuxR family transcriptional regulator [Bradyrhizobium sp.]